MNQNQNNGETKKDAAWFVEGRVNELELLAEFQKQSHFRVVNNVFYDQGEHRLEDPFMKQLIVRELARHVTEHLDRRSNAILNLMRSMWHHEMPDVTDRYIHLQNGTWDSVDDTFSGEKQFSTRRMQVEFDPDAPRPERFLAYLDQLLEPEDILTLQEYLGYCLIPTTKAQKMLVISGKGGEGKSVLGQIMGAMWGESLMYGSIQKVATNQFARADLVNRLVLVDDDMSMEALSQTHYLKTLITLNGKTDVERKGEQSFQAPLYARFIGFTNGTLSALYDKSYGFYRRIILLKTKDRPADRVDYPFLAESIIYDELPGILLWCLRGLDRVFANMYRFTISEKARRNLQETIREADPMGDFLDSEGYFLYDPQGHISSADLYAVFKAYCEDNGLVALASNPFHKRIVEPLTARGARYTKRLPGKRQKTIRGYLGIKAAQPPSWM